MGINCSCGVYAYHVIEIFKFIFTLRPHKTVPFLKENFVVVINKLKRLKWLSLHVLANIYRDLTTKSKLSTYYN